MRHGRHGKPVVSIQKGEASGAVVSKACRALRKSGKTHQAKEVQRHTCEKAVNMAAQYVEFNGFDDLNPCIEEDYGGH